MNPCTFVRITVGNLALKFPSSSSRASNSSEPTHSVLRQPPSTTMPSYFCKIKFSDFRHQIAALPVLLPPDADANCPPLHQNPALSACFNLSKSDLEKLLDKSKSKSKSKSNSKKKSNNKSCLKIDIYSSGRGGVASKSCGLSSGRRFVGRVSMPLELNQAELKTSSLYNGWIRIGEKKRRKGLNAELHLGLKAELDPRFVFEFEGEPECSPQVVHVQGSCRQPVFSCKFSSRHSGYWNSRSSSSISEPGTSRSWLSSWKGKKDQATKERKGWSITIHDLSGSPVAAASMVTPFVPVPGSDRVNRSNPGAWLILRPDEGIWKPWGRLEAWRERGSTDSLCHRFELLPDSATGVGSTGITLSNGAISSKAGGKFSIDSSTFNSPISSPNSSFDLGSWSGSGSASGSGSESGSGRWPHFMDKGFVMSSTIGGEREEGSKPKVEVGVQHVTRTEDAAVFVALAAAMDLSMDACKPFSQKLRKELR
ncbi:hypothetical protein Ancab_027899 [Ancistrocladus abbreviatus]